MEIKKKLIRSITPSNNTECGFFIAWVGKCKSTDLDVNGKCKKHSGIKCVVCGNQATKECDSTGALVCGAPLCDNCKHRH